MPTVGHIPFVMKARLVARRSVRARARGPQVP